jgi:hypothetical protein
MDVFSAGPAARRHERAGEAFIARMPGQTIIISIAKFEGQRAERQFVAGTLRVPSPHLK